MRHVTAILFSLWLVALCATDWRQRRLPNVLTLGGAAAALILHAIAGGGAGVLDSLEGGAICASLLILPFLLKAAGGGDVKMLFAIGCFFGGRHALGALFYISLAGLALAFFFRILVTKEKRRAVPFGLAIAAGAWLEMLLPL